MHYYPSHTTTANFACHVGTISYRTYSEARLLVTIPCMHTVAYVVPFITMKISQQWQSFQLSLSLISPCLIVHSATDLSLTVLVWHTINSSSIYFRNLEETLVKNLWGNISLLVPGFSFKNLQFLSMHVPSSQSTIAKTPTSALALSGISYCMIFPHRIGYHLCFA